MIEITINHNSDSLIISWEEGGARFDKVKDTGQLQKILYEVLNAVYLQESIRLTQIDEDTSMTVGEW